MSEVSALTNTTSLSGLSFFACAVMVDAAVPFLDSRYENTRSNRQEHAASPADDIDFRTRSLLGKRLECELSNPGGSAYKNTNLPCVERLEFSI